MYEPRVVLAGEFRAYGRGQLVGKLSLLLIRLISAATNVPCHGDVIVGASGLTVLDAAAANTGVTDESTFAPGTAYIAATKAPPLLEVKDLLPLKSLGVAIL